MCLIIVMRACMFSHSVMLRSLQPYGLYVARQAPLSMGFSRQEYWSGLPRPPPGDLLDPGIKPRSPALLADSLPSEPSGKSNNCHKDGDDPERCSGEGGGRGVHVWECM